MDIEKILSLNLNKIPLYGLIPITVGGIPATWAALNKRFGKLKLIEVLKPAIKYAEEGFAIQPTVALDWKEAFNIYLNASNNNKIETIIESKVKIDGDKVFCTPLNGNPSFEVNKDNPCSMLMYGFNTDIFEKIETMLIDFLKNADLSTGEFLLPDVVDEYVKMGKVNVLSTPSTWIGMTYKEDLPMVQEKIREYINNGIYPENLWNDYERKNR